MELHRETVVRPGVCVCSSLPNLPERSLPPRCAQLGDPWDVEHDRVLRDSLGLRPPLGGKPTKIRLSLAQVIEELLNAPQLAIDSPPKLLRALQRAGIDAHSTSRWELKKFDHPAIEPLLQYKKMARLSRQMGGRGSMSGFAMAVTIRCTFREVW